MNKNSTPAPGETRLNVTGIIVQNEKRMVIVDGRILGEGGTIGQWTVVKISNSEVVFEDGKEQRVITVRPR